MSTEASGKSLSKDVIVDKALDVLGRHGLAAVSLRRIATELGVSAPTLYWYIGSKRELLDSVAEHLLRKGFAGLAGRPAPGQPWWEWLSERARIMFDVLVSVRDAPQLLAGNQRSPDLFEATDPALGELVAAGFDTEEAQRVFAVLAAFVGGLALEWPTEPDHDGAGVRMTLDYGLAVLIRGIRERHAELP